MPFTKVRTAMTQNGVSLPIKASIFEGAPGFFPDHPGPFISMEGGPWSGEQYSLHDLRNLVLVLDDLCTDMQEVADGTKI